MAEYIKRTYKLVSTENANTTAPSGTVVINNTSTTQTDLSNYYTRDEIQSLLDKLSYLPCTISGYDEEYTTFSAPGISSSLILNCRDFKIKTALNSFKLLNANDQEVDFSINATTGALTIDGITYFTSDVNISDNLTVGGEISVDTLTADLAVADTLRATDVIITNSISASSANLPYVKSARIDTSQQNTSAGQNLIVGATVTTDSDSNEKSLTLNSPFRVAPLDDNGKIPNSYLYSGGGSETIVEYASRSAFPSTGQTGYIYVALDTGATYKWSGSIYVLFNNPLVIGTTTGTAYDGGLGSSLASTVSSQGSALSTLQTDFAYSLNAYACNSTRNPYGAVITDFNTMTYAGLYFLSNVVTTNTPNGVYTNWGSCLVFAGSLSTSQTGTTIHQLVFPGSTYNSSDRGSYDSRPIWWRFSYQDSDSNQAWSSWRQISTREELAEINTSLQSSITSSIASEVTARNSAISTAVESEATTRQNQDALKVNIAGDNATSAGVSTMINKLSTGSSAPQDADYFVSQYVGGGTTTTTYYRRPFSALWTWVKEKIEAATFSLLKATSLTVEIASAWAAKVKRTTSYGAFLSFFANNQDELSTYIGADSSNNLTLGTRVTSTGVNTEAVNFNRTTQKATFAGSMQVVNSIRIVNSSDSTKYVDLTVDSNGYLTISKKTIVDGDLDSYGTITADEDVVALNQ